MLTVVVAGYAILFFTQVFPFSKFNLTILLATKSAQWSACTRAAWFNMFFGLLKNIRLYLCTCMCPRGDLRSAKLYGVLGICGLQTFDAWIFHCHPVGSFLLLQLAYVFGAMLTRVIFLWGKFFRYIKFHQWLVAI